MLRVTINNLFVWKFGTKLAEGDDGTMEIGELSTVLALPATANVVRSFLAASWCAGKLPQQSTRIGF